MKRHWKFEALVICLMMFLIGSSVYAAGQEEEQPSLYEQAYQIYAAESLEKKTTINGETGEDDAVNDAQYWAYTEYVAVPKGRILYFPQVDDFKYNAYFYDENKMYLGKADQIHDFSSMWNVSSFYENACFVRFAGYGNYKAEYNKKVFCYSFIKQTAADDDNLFWEHGLFSGDISAKGFIADSHALCSRTIMHASEPLVMTSDHKNYRIGVAYFTEDGHFLYASHTEAHQASIPSGSHYIIRLFADQEISIKDDLMKHITIKRSLDGQGYYKIDESYLDTDDEMYGTIDIQKAKEDLVIHSDKWDDQVCQAAFYSSSYNDADVLLMKSDLKNDFIIPKNTYYRLNYKKQKRNGVVLYNRNQFADIFYEILGNISYSFDLLNKKQLNPSSQEVPDYYKEHIKQKTAEIEQEYSQLTEGTQFIFLTDYHYNGYAQSNNSTVLIDELLRKTHLSRIFNGGDNYNSKAVKITKEECMKIARDSFLKTLPTEDTEYYFILGNHDTGFDYKDGVPFGDYLTPEEVYDLSGMSRYRSQLTIDPNSSGMGYFFDDDHQKIRYIVTNLNLENEGGHESNDKIFDFIASALFNTKKDYTVVFLGHKLFNEGTKIYDGTTELLKMMDAYKQRSIYTATNGQKYNFTHGQGTIACLIAGHNHWDYSIESTGGIPVIITTSDNYGGQSARTDIVRTAGTISEQAFDVFTIDTKNRTIRTVRIGSGENREFHY